MRNTSTITVRFAELHEREKLEDLQRRASLANPTDREAILAHPDAISLPRDQIEARRVLVLEEDKIIQGFAVILPPMEQVAELDGMFVDPPAWRMGYGHRLLEECARIAEQERATSLHVIANPQAIAFYQTCGFIKGEPVPTRFGPGLSMSKAL